MLSRRLVGQAEPAAAAGYFFGHFAGGFVDHFTFEADCAATFALGRLAIGGQYAFGSGVDQWIGRLDAVDCLDLTRVNHPFAVEA